MQNLIRTPDTQLMLADSRLSAETEQEFSLPVRADLETVRSMLDTFEPITLSQMADAALMDRSERKYVLPQSLLLPALSGMRDAYQVLVAAGRPLSRYLTLYFDTDDMALYRRHHAGAPDRYKVRSREYVDSNAAFLEVKHKMVGGRTVKNRIPTSQLVTEFTPETADFVTGTCPYSAAGLSPRIWNHYTRITLVNKNRPERVTLDLDLGFVRGEDSAGFPGIVIAEVKYQGPQFASEFVRLMRTYHVRDTGFSKYCMGVSLLYPDVKHNAFKAKHRLVARLAQETTL